MELAWSYPQASDFHIGIALSSVILFHFCVNKEHGFRYCLALVEEPEHGVAAQKLTEHLLSQQGLSITLFSGDAQHGLHGPKTRDYLRPRWPVGQRCDVNGTRC